MKPRVLTGYLPVAIAACTWGTWPIFLHAANRVRPVPSEIVSFTVMVGLSLAGGICLLRDRSRVKPTRGQWALVAWLGFTDVANNVLFFRAYRTTTVAIAVLTHYLTPLFVAVAAPILRLETWRSRTALSVAIALAGLVLLLAPWRDSIGPTAMLGAAYGAGSAVFYASNVLVSKRLVPVFSGAEMTCFHGLVGVGLLAFLAPPSMWRELDPSSYLPLFLSGLLPGAFACLLFVWGLRRVPASHAGALTLLEPLTAVLVGVALYGERIDPAGGAGAALILAGAAMVVGSSGPATATKKASSVEKNDG